MHGGLRRFPVVLGSRIAAPGSQSGWAKAMWDVDAFELFVVPWSVEDKKSRRCGGGGGGVMGCDRAMIGTTSRCLLW